jgi:hypothetical protein
LFHIAEEQTVCEKWCCTGQTFIHPVFDGARKDHLLLLTKTDHTSYPLSQKKQNSSVPEHLRKSMTGEEDPSSILGEPGAPESTHVHHEDPTTSALIAEAAAAAMGVELPVADVDITMAALAAAGDDHGATAAGATTATGADSSSIAAAGTTTTPKKTETRRNKRYREKADEEAADGKKTKAASAGSSVAGSASPSQSHEESLAARRLKDRQRYANMTAEQRQQYNAKRREQYHRQNGTLPFTGLELYCVFIILLNRSIRDSTTANFRLFPHFHAFIG